MFYNGSDSFQVLSYYIGAVKALVKRKAVPMGNVETHQAKLNFASGKRCASEI